MASFAMNLLVLFSGLALCSAEWKPADSVADLDAVEMALHMVENATLAPEQKKAAAHVVASVEGIVAQLSTNKTMTKAQKMEKAKVAVEQLQGLQAQWELAAVEGSLTKVADMPHLNSEQRAAAKKVVADVESIAKDVEAGKLSGPARNRKVALAIKELQDLQQQWQNVSSAGLQKELAMKQALLKRDEAELKLAHLQKELAEKKLMLKKLAKDKSEEQEAEKQSKEDAAQAAMVAKLLSTAKELAASKKNDSSTVSKATGAAKASVASGAATTISSLVADLDAREQKVTKSLERMDAEEKSREDAMSASITLGEKASSSAETDATRKGQKMLKRLLKQEHRKFLKSRARVEAQRQELAEGIRSIKSGDMKSLTHLQEKMQKEQKSMQAKTGGFLY